MLMSIGKLKIYKIDNFFYSGEFVWRFFKFFEFHENV
jgi:hypothetical protein